MPLPLQEESCRSAEQLKVDKKNMENESRSESVSRKRRHPTTQARTIKEMLINQENLVTKQKNFDSKGDKTPEGAKQTLDKKETKKRRKEHPEKQEKKAHRPAKTMYRSRKIAKVVNHYFEFI